MDEIESILPLRNPSIDVRNLMLLLGLSRLTPQGKYAWMRSCLLSVSLIAGCSFLYSVFHYSSTPRYTADSTTLLISLDGFRAEYLRRGLTPTLLRLGERGIIADYMLPSFPTITFPNHYTLVTGLRPEQHGIVTNRFYDPLLNRTYNNHSPEDNGDFRWWTEAEPLWITTERQGIRSGTLSWPGSESPSFLPDGILRRPSIWTYFNHSMTPIDRVDTIISWLRLPEKERPKFLALYIPDVDEQGHKYGPNSAEVNATLSAVDQALQKLINFIEIELPPKRIKLLSAWQWRSSEGKQIPNLPINVVIVSDHGMTEAPTSQYIPLYNIIPMEKVTIYDSWPILMLNANNSNDTDSVIRQLQQVSKQYNYTAFRKGDVPESFHFSNNGRIPDIVAIPDVGYVFALSDKFNATRGMHGYVPTHEDMHTIFAAAGPAIQLISNEERSKFKVFENTKVYGFLCTLLGVSPAESSKRGV